MHYTQKEIRSILNISRETLRFYEKEGIIAPAVNKENQYRCYSEEDLYRICECKRYQINGFSIKEIREILKNNDLAQYRSLMAEKLRIQQEKALYYTKLSAFTADYLSRLQKTEQSFNEPEIMHMETILFAPQKDDAQLLQNPEAINASRYMMDNLEFSFMMTYHPDFSSPSSLWGFGIRDNDLSSHLETKGMVRIPASDAVICITTQKEPWNICSTDITRLIQYADQHNKKPKGTLLALQLKGKGKHSDDLQYCELLVPLEDLQ